MWKYLAGVGVLVAGFGLGFFTRSIGSSPNHRESGALVATPVSTAASSAPAAVSGPAAAAPAAQPETAVAASNLSVSETGTQTLELALNVGPTQPITAAASNSAATAPAEVSAAAEVQQPATPTTEELLAVARDKRGTPEGKKAVEELARRYRKEGRERRAATVELEGATGPERARILGRIEEMNRTFLASGKPSAGTELVVVKSGDTLSGIGSQLQITPKFLMKLNGLKSDLIRVGQKLKVMKGPLSVVVDKGDFRLTVYVGDEVFREYPIGLGANDSTPTGSFKVEGKLTEPTWWNKGVGYDYGDPKNPLGTRWISLKKGYGIHGTWDEKSIGVAASSGCVRLRNRDVEELFDLLVLQHSTVTVQD
ncbi:MAG: L,D-transpeptidase family protein [Planctomycetes bacterium]|nr:L,D-transpeptidase family protein [Planctomycetota bacterium]